MTDNVIFNLINPIDEMNMVELENVTTETSKVHIRIVKRNRRKCVTIVEKIPEEFDLKLILKEIKKKFTCGGAIKRDSDDKVFLKITGDKRDEIKNFLIEEEIMEKDRIIVHGY